MKQELTLPEISQTLVLTRTAGRASAMPATETLEAFARTGATLAIHLSIHMLKDVVARLVPLAASRKVFQRECARFGRRIL